MMLKVRELTAIDIDLLQSCAALEAISICEPWSFGSFVQEAKRKEGLILAALDEKECLFGFLTATCIPETADLTNVAVFPEHRRKGIAGMLVSELKNRVQGSCIFLEVRESNAPAIAFYRKHGFLQVGIRKRFYRLPEEDALLMKWEGMKNADIGN